MSSSLTVHLCRVCAHAYRCTPFFVLTKLTFVTKQDHSQRKARRKINTKPKMGGNYAILRGRKFLTIIIWVASHGPKGRHNLSQSLIYLADASTTTWSTSAISERQMSKTQMTASVERKQIKTHTRLKMNAFLIRTRQNNVRIFDKCCLRQNVISFPN